MNNLRLLLFEDCERNCAQCCNNHWDLKALPLVRSDFSKWDMVLLTGGEPMLRPKVILAAVQEIRETNPTCPIIVYTAKVDNIDDFFQVFYHVDGFTVTLHDQDDVEPWYYVHQLLSYVSKPVRNMRLNVFAGIDLSGCGDPNDWWHFRKIWQVKEGIEWLEDCPLPEGETFMRYM